jgi:hypothetical protein
MLELLNYGDSWKYTKYILSYEMSMSLWGPEAECYGLDTKYPPQVHVFKAWSSAHGTVEI